MSSVTDIILTTAVEDKGILDVNDYLREHYRTPLVHIDDKKAGGDKMHQVEIYTGAFNYLDTNELLEEIDTANWESPEDVSVFVQEEAEDKMRQRR